LQAVDMGFDGKTLIHPSTISIANEVFSPSMEDVVHAKRVVQAYEEASARGETDKPDQRIVLTYPRLSLPCANRRWCRCGG
jgi:citrate lyase beta subunit